MPDTFTNLLAHIVFSTKDRQPVLDAEWRDRLDQYLAGTVRDLGGRLIATGGTADHVHLLCKLPPTVAISTLMRDVKANSSGWINRQRLVRGRFGWQDGYGAFSVSESRLASVREYIAKQVEHHRTRDFQEEFAAFLQRHGIELDVPPPTS